VPVLVTDAHTSVGEQIVRRILREGGEVRAFGAGVDGSLRAASAIVANADADDEGRLEAALEQVHTVIHPGPSLLAEADIPAEIAAATLATAAENAGVRRIIALSVLGAGGGDPYREAKGRAEQLLEDGAVPTVVVRTGLVATSDAVARLRTLPAEDAAMSLSHAPLRPDDLLDALAGLDVLRSTAQQGHVVFHAVGPDKATLGAWLAGAQGGLGHAESAGSRVGSVYRPIREGSQLIQALRTDAWVPGPDDGPDVFAFLSIPPRPA